MSKPAKEILTNLPTKRTIVPATNKGGVGKSFGTIQLTDYVANHPKKLRVRGFDPDDANRTFQRYFPKLVTPLDPNEEACFDAIVTATDDCDVTILDGAGAKHRNFAMWEKEINLLDTAREIGMTVTYLLVLENDPEGIDHANALTKSASKEIEWIVLLNEKQTKSFAPVQKSYAWGFFKEAEEQGRAAMAFMPRLMDKISVLLQNESLSIGEAQRNPQEFDLLNRQRFNSLHREYTEKFDAMQHLILPKSFLA